MSGLFRPVAAGPARHVLDLVTRPEYRTACMLESRWGSTPRRSERQIHVHGWTLRVPDVASFLVSYRELFVDENLAFAWDGENPRILDLGANIGLSVLYYKRLFPHSRIVAFEADPTIFRFLVENVRGNGFQDVELVNRAAWDSDERLRFLPDGADGGAVREDSGAGGFEVEGCDLAAFLKSRSFDVVKMDIEGAERRVLPAIAPHLGSVRRLFVEYHSRLRESQDLDRVVGAMAGAGFRLHVRSVWSPRAPLLAPPDRDGFDMQLFLFGWRE
jgi:FkbM family methyltransferase